MINARLGAFAIRAFLAGLVMLFNMPAQADLAIMSGQVNILEDVELPRGARMEVEIIDASDAAQTRLASVQYIVEGKPPYKFSIGYDTDLAKATKRHRMKATITLGDLALYREAEPTRVDLSGDGAAPPEILMSPVSLPGGGGSPVDKTWELISLNREPALSHARTLLTLDGESNISGHAACNRLSGGFELTDESLVFKRISTTKRGCQSPVMQQERDFLRALARTRGYRVDGEVFTLLDAGGLELARLQQSFN